MYMGIYRVLLKSKRYIEAIPIFLLIFLIVDVLYHSKHIPVK